MVLVGEFVVGKSLGMILANIMDLSSLKTNGAIANQILICFIQTCLDQVLDMVVDWSWTKSWTFVMDQVLGGRLAGAGLGTRGTEQTQNKKSVPI